MAEDRKSLEEWLAEERARQKEGFTYEGQPTTEAGSGSAAGEALAGLGLAAGVAGGALAPHANPVIFQGCKASTIAEALRAELPDDDTVVEVRHDSASVIVTVLEGRRGRSGLRPMLSVTLVERANILTVTVGDLTDSSLRDTMGTVAGALLDSGRHLLLRRRGVGGLLDTAGRLMDNVEDVVGEVQDLNLPRRVWAIIDRVGRAAEEAYLEEQHRARILERQREAELHAWTHCPYCGRAYAESEQNVVTCPSCGGPRGPKPSWAT
jgi:hypothetical protein